MERLNAFASGSNYFLEQICYPTPNIFYRKAFDSIKSMGSFLKENYTEVKLESNLVGLKAKDRIYCEDGVSPDPNSARILKAEEKQQIESIVDLL